MNLSAAAAVVAAVLVIVVECGAYSPTSTKFDWSPNRNSPENCSPGRSSHETADDRHFQTTAPTTAWYARPSPSACNLEAFPSLQR